MRPGQTKAIRKYRTSDGTGADYMFSFEKQSDGSWCVYIVQQPGYGLRASGAHETHRLGIGSRPYICWNTRIPTYEKARGVAKMWADATQRYIRDGTRF